jgi:hypothetical protein
MFKDSTLADEEFVRFSSSGRAISASEYGNPFPFGRRKFPESDPKIQKKYLKSKSKAIPQTQAEEEFSLF